MTTEMPIHGHCNSRFGAVKDTFVANFAESGEVGARLAIIQDGESVVDLWGGHTTEVRDGEWDEDTLVCCMSVSKGVTALAAHVLADRGQLDYDAPVARYWPEFAANGKEAITVREAMSHQASLCIIDAAEPGDALDWDVFTAKIAAQAPNWPPCTDETYHSVTYGYIVGEIVQRVDGRPIAQFIQEELAGPLDADFILGCSDEDMARVAPRIFNPDNEMMGGGGLINENTARVFNPLPADPGFLMSEDFVKTIFPSGSGVSNGMGMARLMAPLACGGKYNGVQLLSQESIRLACEEQWHHEDSLFGNDFRVSLGLLLQIPFNDWGREGNVGTAGAGGYMAFADPENRLSFGYSPNRFTTGSGLGNEPRRLVDAVYGALSA